MIKYLLPCILMLQACASAPPIKPERPHIRQYVLDPASSMLRGKTEAEDLPIKYCDAQTCIVVLNTDMKRIELHVIDLESRVEACQK